MIRPLSGFAAVVMLAAWALPSSAQTPAKTHPAVRDNRGLRVQITMDQLQCLKTTARGSQSDELALLVAGKAPAGMFKRHLPTGNGTYVFKTGQKAGATGWKTADGKERGRPVLFSGSLKPGETVRLTMLMIEHDKPTGVAGKVKKASGLLGKVGSALGKVGSAAGKIAGKVEGAVKKVTGALDKVSDVFGKVSGVAEGLLGKDIKALGTVSKAIEKAKGLLKADGHEYVGGVTVVVKNVNGKLQVSYHAGAQTKDVGADAAGRNFEMTGSGARYKATLNVK